MVMEKKYGDYIVTGTRLGILLDHMISVDRKYPVSFERKQFTEVIGATPTSNGPAEKLKDMIDFGLVTRDNQNYIISDLGKVAVNGETADRSAAIEKIIRKIPLWDQLLNTIGQKPDREAFVQASERILHLEPPISTRNLDRLWHAYVEDIGCIVKTPPYSRGSALLGKQKPSKAHPSNILKTPEQIIAHSKIPNEQKQIVSTSQNHKGPVGQIPIAKITLDVGGVKFEVKDVSSITVARFLINALEERLSRGSDYEQ